MKRPKSIILWLISLCLWLVLLSLGQREQPVIKGDKFLIEFINRPLQSFISHAEMQKELEILQVSSQAAGLKEINIKLLEESLDNHSSIEKAEVYSDIDGTVHIKIWQQQPLARLMSKNRSEYLTANGTLMPLSDHYSEKVPLVTGSLAFAQKEQVARFWKMLSEKEHLLNSFSGLHCAVDSNWILYPAKGDYQINLGKATELKKKMENLENFFRFSGEIQEINKLESINLEFNNQVICRKKQI
jgi:cell division protein FtsQ